MKRFKKYLLTGLAVIVPVFVTFWVIVASFLFVDDILNRYVQKLFNFYIPGLGFVLFLSLIVFVGFLATRFLGHRLFIWLEKWFAAFPLIKDIYPPVKQMIGFMSAQRESGFKKVVLVEYPGKGLWSLGFLTNEQFAAINAAMDADMVSVYVSTVPGPFSGMLVFVRKSEVKFPDISVKDAVKIIFSGGVVNPQILEKQHSTFT
jgi:uncharacterized membrane protein